MEEITVSSSWVVAWDWIEKQLFFSLPSKAHVNIKGAENGTVSEYVSLLGRLAKTKIIWSFLYLL